MHVYALAHLQNVRIRSDVHGVPKQSNRMQANKLVNLRVGPETIACRATYACMHGQRFK